VRACARAYALTFALQERLRRAVLQRDESKLTHGSNHTDLVVLSACRTGQGRIHNGEGVSGLARVFLYAGSRGVVCSLWGVDDNATEAFMRVMYQRLEKDDSAADALRAVRLALIADGQPPLFWAPFILMGR
jgi:CHAT domain-containing protein